MKRIDLTGNGDEKKMSIHQNIYLIGQKLGNIYMYI